MPKPNKKRIEARQDPNNRLKGCGKLYIPEGLTAAKPTGTISSAKIKAGSIPLPRINLDDLARELRLDDQIENTRKSRPRKTTED